MGKKQGTWVNAMMFYQAWKDMRDTGKTADSDWVIKTDVDAVFLPERLLKRLQGFHVPQGVSSSRTAKRSSTASSATWKLYPRTHSTPSWETSRRARRPSTGRAKTPTGSGGPMEKISSCRSAW